VWVRSSNQTTQTCQHRAFDPVTSSSFHIYESRLVNGYGYIVFNRSSRLTGGRVEIMCDQSSVQTLRYRRLEALTAPSQVPVEVGDDGGEVMFTKPSLFAITNLACYVQPAAPAPSVSSTAGLEALVAGIDELYTPS